MSKFMYTVLTGLALAAGLAFTEAAHAVPTAEATVQRASFAAHEWGPGSYGEAIHVAEQLEKQGYRTKIENRGGGRHYVIYW